MLQLADKYQDFVTASEREEFTATLQQVEDWLYEDGEDETKGVYNAKLEELKKVSFIHYKYLLPCYYLYSSRLSYKTFSERCLFLF